jgi:hypothetical protein
MKIAKYLLVICFLYVSTVSFGQVEDIYEVVFTVDDVTYRGALLMFDSMNGKMRLRYEKEDVGMVMVEQTMTLKNATDLVHLEGSNPVYPDTNDPFPGYNPDDFFVTIDGDGNMVFTNIDSQGQIADTNIKLVEARERRRLLNECNWAQYDK